MMAFLAIIPGWIKRGFSHRDRQPHALVMSEGRRIKGFETAKRASGLVESDKICAREQLE